MIILLGVAGSGKSMQGRLLSDTKGYAWISTGEILRVLVTGSRRQAMQQGQLLSDEEMIKLMSKVFEIIDPNDEFVLDGFPRTAKQAEWLFSQEIKKMLSRILVIHLYADEQTVMKRLTDRGRLDDTEQAIAKRFNEYREVTLPIINELKSKGIQVYDIDASRTPEEIHGQIMEIVSKK